jgi:hypothetical protein
VTCLRVQQSFTIYLWIQHTAVVADRPITSGWQGHPVQPIEQDEGRLLHELYSSLPCDKALYISGPGAAGSRLPACRSSLSGPR